jgi:hypothetical protein
MVFWPYADFADPRYTFGTNAVLLRQVADRPATKIGLGNPLGSVGYLNAGTLFIKRFGFQKGAKYPDLGSNFETFTNGDMLELETLSPLVRIGSGESVEHEERWELVTGVGEVKTLEDAAREVLPRLLRK